MDVAGKEPRGLERVDLEAGMETQRLHAPRTWRWGAAAIALTLCVAGAVLLTWNMQDPDHSQGGSGLQHKLRELAGTDKAAIHLEGYYNATRDSVVWSVDTGHAFSQGDLMLEQNEIVILKTGLYFVYSQASFRINCHAKAGARDAGKVVYISHAVSRQSESYANSWKDLMSSLRPTCRKLTDGGDSGRRWHNSIYLGAVYSLMEGDRLRTDTEKSLLSSLEWEDGKTFFGAFAL
ncbi:hypothetical protein GJAV_G00105850 [Gymnothorax javanicus]|nr:hypothetical protein GJAV_G00105850 [Gymnothorax javanicus]